MPTALKRKISIIVGMDTKQFSRAMGVVRQKLARLKDAAVSAAKKLVVVAAIMAAAVGAFLVKATLVAARTQVLNRVLLLVGKTAGYTQEQLIAVKDSLIGMGIAEQEAIGLQLRFMQSNLKLTDAMKVARAAQDLAVISGQNSSETAMTLTNAIVMQRPILLKQFGIVLGLHQIYDKLAKSLGKSRDELTPIEKKQAFLNTILDQASRVSGAYVAAMKDVGKQLTSMPRYLQEAYISIGKHFLPEMEKVVQTMKAFLKAIKEVGELKALGKVFENVRESVRGLNESLSRLFPTITEGGIEAWIFGAVAGISVLIISIAEFVRFYIDTLSLIYKRSEDVIARLVDLFSKGGRVIGLALTSFLPSSAKKLEGAVRDFNAALKMGVLTARVIGAEYDVIEERALTGISRIDKTLDVVIKEWTMKRLGLLPPEEKVEVTEKLEEKEPTKESDEIRLQRIRDYNAFEAQIDKLHFENKLVGLSEYEQSRLTLINEYQELRNEIIDNEVLNESQKFGLIYSLKEAYHKKIEALEKETMKRKEKYWQAGLGAMMYASEMWGRNQLALHKAVAVSMLEITGKLVNEEIAVLRDAFLKKALAYGLAGNIIAAAKYTAGAMALTAGMGYISASVERTTKAWIGEDEGIPGYDSEEAFQGTREAGPRTRSAYSTRGVQNLYIQPSVSITGDTVIVGDTGLEAAASTIGQIAVESVKDALETGEITLGGNV